MASTEIVVEPSPPVELGFHSGLRGTRSFETTATNSKVDAKSRIIASDVVITAFDHHGHRTHFRPGTRVYCYLRGDEEDASLSLPCLMNASNGILLGSMLSDRSGVAFPRLELQPGVGSGECTCQIVFSAALAHEEIPSTSPRDDHAEGGGEGVKMKSSLRACSAKFDFSTDEAKAAMVAMLRARIEGVRAALQRYNDDVHRVTQEIADTNRRLIEAVGRLNSRIFE